MRVFSIKLSELSIIVFVAVIVLCGLTVTKKEAGAIAAMMPVMQKTIVIDAGHGGFDPGKCGSLEDEKNINLAIAKNLQIYLEQGGANVYMTRCDDQALGNKKQEDMKQRKLIANDNDADMLISIHQNAFPKPSAKGAQVFYHKESPSGRLLAESIQRALKDCDTNNTREAKPNTDYYILRTTTTPTALVECGFLSNPKEEELLNTQQYQEQIAWAIYVGIISYLENENADTAMLKELN